MKITPTIAILTLAGTVAVAAATLENKPADPYFEKFQPVKAPSPSGLVLKPGDRLAICGDSITEQKMYSRIMETYLTVCQPALGVSVRQYGWGGERAPGFLNRMTNDCLRFKPTVATTCYGMNDHGYRAYEPGIGDSYRKYSTAIVQAFKNHGARVIQGSPGCVGTRNAKDWDAAGVEVKNLNLCTLRNIGIEIAAAENAGFADVFWPMLTAGFEGRKKYGANYAIAGRDGVHPGWAGHWIMACAFLKALGLSGDLGTITVDLQADAASAAGGHKVLNCRQGEIRIESSRYPFCAAGDPAQDNSIRSGMTLPPFYQELNRFMLIAKNGKSAQYDVSWGKETHTYSAAQLAQGVNLAADFAENPFMDAFKAVDKAVADKQAYETKQIKQIFHDLARGKYKNVDDIKDPELKELFALRGADGKFDMDTLAQRTETKRAALVEAIRRAFVPVTHSLKISPK